MRIGIVTGEYPPMQGGVGAFSQILAGELSRQGHDVFVFSTQHAQSEHPTIRLTNPIRHWRIGSLGEVQRWANECRLDIINLQFQTAAFGMSPWIHYLPHMVRPRALVTTFHDLRVPYLFPKAGRLRDWIVMHLARTSSGVIATNHEDWSRVQALPQTALIPIGSNILQALPSEFDPAHWRQQAGVESGDFLLAYFGLLNHSKGIDTLLNALALLRQNGTTARLVMVGGVGSSDPTNIAYAEEINRQISRLGLSSHVYQTGFLEEIAVGAWLAASDAVVLPFRDGASYRRGSLMAAIRYGCPIVTTAPTMTIPVFADKVNMLLVKPDDSLALAEAVCSLIAAPDLQSRLRAGAQELAALFDWPQIAQQTAAFFRKIIGAANP